MLVFGFSFNSAHAATGLDYLSAQQNVDGSLGNTATSLATPVQTTSETLRAYQALGQQNQPAYAPALGYLNGDPEANTEFLARKIVVNAQVGNNTIALINELLTHQNVDGGFGDQAGYDSSAFDTAYALEALAAAHYSAGQSVAAAAGYLLNYQNANGGWAVEDNDPVVFVTAQVMRSLWFYRSTYQGVPSALTNAQNFVLSQRGLNGLWSEDFETALALLAIVPNVTDLSLITGSVTALQSAELANGSWDNDPYTTALALQALQAFGQRSPGTGPTTGSISGYVIQAGSTQPIAGATVTLVEQPGIAVLTNADGYFVISSLNPGAYTVTATKAGYNATSLAISTQAGQVALAGNLILAPSSLTGLVRGRVYQATDTSAIAGATISLSGAASYSAVSDSAGAFDLGAMAAGAYTLSIQKSGYYTVSGGVIVASGQTLIINQGLTAAGAFQDSGPATVSGTVIDATTGAPITGAVFTLGPGFSATSTVTGAFAIAAVPRGSYSATLSAAGYVTQGYALSFPAGASGNLGTLVLYPAVSVTTVTSLSLTGLVVDQSSGRALAGATATLSGAANLVVNADVTGRFTFSNLAGGTYNLSIAYPGYNSIALSYTLSGPQSLDAGTLSLTQIAFLGLGVGTDKINYGPNKTVNLIGIVSNTTAAPGSGSVTFDIYQANNVLVAHAGAASFANPAANAQQTLSATWSTGTATAGAYYVLGSLFDSQNQLLGTARSPFNILANDPNCGQPTGNMAVIVVTIPGSNPANLTPVLRFAFDGIGPLTPLTPIPAFPQTLANDPIYPAFSPRNELFVSNRQGNVPGTAGSIARFKFDSAGNFIANGAVTGNALEAVHGIAFSSSGELFASNLLTGTISRFKFDSAGNALPNGTFYSGTLYSQGLAFSSSGELFITDSYKYVQRWRFDPHTGDPVHNGVLYVPGALSLHDLAFDAKGELFIGDIGTNQIFRFLFDNAGNAISHGSIAAPTPIGIAFSPTGEMFVTAHGAGNISRFLFDQNGHAISNGVISTGSTNLGGVAITTTPISMDPQNLCAAAATATITTDKTVYLPADTVQVTEQIANPTLNQSLDKAIVVTKLFKSDGTVLWSTSEALAQLNPGSQRDFSYRVPLSFAAPGNYTVSLTVNDAQGTVLASSSISFAVQSSAVPGLAFSVATDQASYPANTPVAISATVTNATATAISGQVQLTIRASGSPTALAPLPPIPVTNLAAGAQQVYTATWNTATTLAGRFEVDAQLLDAQGQVLAQGSALFDIGAPPVSVTTKVTTDKTLYNAWDTAALTVRVTNVAANAILAPSRVELTVLTPAGTTLYFNTGNVGELVPGALTDVPFTLTLTDTASGQYSVQLLLKDDFTRAVLSTGTTSFQVNRRDIQALTGNVSVAAPRVYQGDSNRCTETAKNVSGTALSGVRLIHQLINVDTGTVVGEVTETVDLPAGGVVHNYFSDIDTSTLALGGYSCVINAELNGATKTLAFGGFRVVPPPIRIDADLTLGAKGRLLVLLDNGQHGEDESDGHDDRSRDDHKNDMRRCDGVKQLSLSASFGTPLSNAATVTARITGHDGVFVDSESASLAGFPGALNLSAGSSGADLVLSGLTAQGIELILQPLGGAQKLGDEYSVEVMVQDGNTLRFASGTIRTDCTTPLNQDQAIGSFTLSGLDVVPVANDASYRDTDPHGPAVAPGLKAQRAFLETLLKAKGWSYTITDMAEDFTKEHRSGGYTVYAVFAEQEKLAEQVQKELREAVFRGEGLVVAGIHDARNQKLHDALGIKLIGSVPVNGVDLMTSSFDLTGHIDLIAGDQALRMKRIHADTAGVYTVSALQVRSDQDDCHDEGARYDAASSTDGADKDHKDDDECEGHPERYLDAVTTNAYGKDQSFFAGFDLLATATRDGQGSLAATLLAKSLEHVHLAELPRTPGAVVPLTLTLTNRGIATAAIATISLPAGTAVVDPDKATAGANTLVFNVNLAVGAQQHLTFWVKLPQPSGPVTFQAIVTAPNLAQPAAAVSYTVTVLQPESLTSIDDRLTQLIHSGSPNTEALRHAENYVAKALKNFFPPLAISDLLKATDALLGINDPAVVDIRVALDVWIRWAGQYAF